jgi:mono/diheme cytochrome c family protein
VRFLSGLVAGPLLLAAVVLAVVYAGVYDVAASAGHSRVMRWLLETAMERSVRRRAAGIVAPRLDAPDLVAAGARHYDAMCVGCHGAPGVPRGEAAEGLLPEPADLARAVPRWRAAELYWITRHGIEMTGMPAWGATHSDGDLWAIVAFLLRLPELTAEAYREATGSPARGHRRGP